MPLSTRILSMSMDSPNFFHPYMTQGLKEDSGLAGGLSNVMEMKSWPVRVDYQGKNLCNSWTGYSTFSWLAHQTLSSELEICPYRFLSAVISWPAHTSVQITTKRLYLSHSNIVHNINKPNRVR